MRTDVRIQKAERVKSMDNFVLMERMGEILMIDEEIERLQRRRVWLLWEGLDEGERFQLGLMLLREKGEIKFDD